MTQHEYLLQKIAEECNEVAHRISKVLCFGGVEVQKGQELPNDQRVAQEFVDLLAVYEMCQKHGLVPDVGFKIVKDSTREAMEDKKRKVLKWMLHSRDVGTLDGPG